jgi:PAS domain S-box-containing protein
MADLERRITYTNSAFRRMVGRPLDELIGLPVEGLTAPSSLGVSSGHLDRLEKSGEPQRYSKTYAHSDGREIPVEVLVDLYRDPEGQPCGFYAFITEMSEQRRTEAALRQSEERFRQLYDEAPFGYHEIDASGRILMVNQTECDMLGYTREELIGRLIFDFIAEDERAAAQRAVRDRMAGDTTQQFVERTYVTRDGRKLALAIENRAIRDASGRIVGMRSTAQDVSWRRRAEADLVASERRVRALFEGIEDAVIVHDLDGRILDANPSICRWLGYSREEMLGLRTSDIDDPSFAAGYSERLARQVRDGRLRVEGQYRTKSGRVIPVDINTSLIQLEDQKVVLAVVRDITERKAFEETRRQFAEAQLKNAWEIEAKNRQLRQSEARYRQLTEGCLDAIVVTDSRGRITLFNPAAEHTFGTTATAWIGRPLAELFSPQEAREELMNSLEEYLRTGASHLVGQTFERMGLRESGGPFPLEVSLSAIEMSGEIQFMAAIRDQVERQRMRQMLMQSEKLASIGLLSAGVAHEINNPLAYIANNLAVLERDVTGILAMVSAYESAGWTLEAEAPEAAERVATLSEELDWQYVRENVGRLIARTRDGVQRVANIVQNLRGLARTAPPKLEPAQLQDLIAAAIEMVQGRLRRGGVEIELDVRTAPKLLCVPSQIGQVILNLLVNAIQATEESTPPPGGHRIRVSTRSTPTEQVVEIADTGPGIPAEALPRLFDPFFTTKPVGEGTGLGLSISHGIVTGHGGRIEVESEPGQGSRFRVVLPVRPESRTS